MDDFRTLLEEGETLEWHGQPDVALRWTIGDDVHYLITDRRVLVVDGGTVEAFTPAALAKLELRHAGDGTSDVVWDVAEGFRQPQDQPGLRVRFRLIGRDDRIGFIGVADGAAVFRRLEDWLAARHATAAAASLADWRTLREPATGFAIDVPTAWSARVGVLKEFRFLGIRIQRPPRWASGPNAPWNTLEATLADTVAALVVLLNPLELPDSLDAVLGSRLMSALGIRVVASNPAVRIGDLAGFSVLQDLQGAASLQLQLGPVSISTGGFKDRLLQGQTWLRGPAGNVHLLSVTPAQAEPLRAVTDRIVASVRFER